MPAPTGAEPRWAAAQVAQRVLDQGQASDAAMEVVCQGLTRGQDRALARRLVHGLMRDWPMVSGLLKALLQTPLKRRDRGVYFILCIGLSELRAEREPDHAAVNAAVEATKLAKAKHMSKLVNAVLRRFLREREALEADQADALTVQWGHPAWFIQALQHDWPEDWQRILGAGNASPPLTLRVNRRHWSRDDALSALTQHGLEAHPIPGLADAVELERRVAIRDIPEFSTGGWSVQDASAQWAVDWLQLTPGLRVLDACAGPGGKAAHALERADIELHAVDSDGERLARVETGLARLGLSAQLIHADATSVASWWDGGLFDRVLLDAPCSATGVIRRHPDIRWLRQAGDLSNLVATQRALLDALWPLVKPGGILVYVTCSVLADENDRQMASFVERHSDGSILQSPPTPTAPGRAVSPGWQVLPGEGGWDGFYFAAVERV